MFMHIPKISLVVKSNYSGQKLLSYTSHFYMLVSKPTRVKDLSNAHSSVGPLPYPQTLNRAGITCQKQML